MRQSNRLLAMILVFAMIVSAATVMFVASADEPAVVEAGANLLLNKTYTVTFDGTTNVDDGVKATDGKFRGDGTNAWNGDLKGDVSMEFMGTGKTVTYTFTFAEATDVAEIVFKSVRIASNRQFGTVTVNGTTVVTSAAAVKTAIDGAPKYGAESADQFFDVSIPVELTGITELTIALLTDAYCCQYDEVEAYAPAAVEDPSSSEAETSEDSSEDAPVEGTEEAPYQVFEPMSIVAPANSTVYYAVNFKGGMNMVVTAGGVEVVNDIVAGFYAVYSYENNTDADVTLSIDFVVPLGSMDNPADLVIGENTADIAAGSQGYYYTWTATEAGTLSITMPAGQWTYTINNLTSSAYGDAQWSDSDPVVPVGTVDVAAGDEIQIIVCTYDAADPWNAPAGLFTFTAAFEAAEAYRKNSFRRSFFLSIVPLLYHATEVIATNSPWNYVKFRLQCHQKVILGVEKQKKNTDPWVCVLSFYAICAFLIFCFYYCGGKNFPS